MRAGVRGLLLFSFAFSSVLSSPEIFTTPGGKHEPLAPSAAEAPINNTSINSAINRGYFKQGSCSGAESIEKREITYPQENKGGELKKAVDIPEPGSGSPYLGYVHMNNGIEKRARVGFTGMRGKKDSYLSESYVDKGAPQGEEDLETFLDILEKRSRMGFNGMRGKKYEGSEKRGQMLAFHGMRGKRLDDYDGYPERVRGLYELIPWREIQNEEEFSGEEIPISKKGTMAFHGMRGRRSEEPVFVKRFPAPPYDSVQDGNGFGFKRTMGFLGMRGKKTPESWGSGDYEKRGIQSGFFGMKGKKAQSGFFGMRGKKSLSDVPGASDSPNNPRKENKAVMKFKFCGDLDCPDWVLAEMNTLSKMSSVKMKLLCQIVAKTLLGEQLDEEKALKLLLDAKLNENDMKACTQVLNHILTSSARYEVEEEALNSELQQLGLPKEHATALCKVYSENMSAITEKLGAKSLRTSSMEEVSWTNCDNGTMELNLRVRDHIKDRSSFHSINLSQEQLALLLKDLKHVRDEMKNLPN